MADEKGWIFDRHVNEIKSRLAEQFDFGIAYRKNDIRTMSNDYDLVYILDPMAMRSWSSPKKTVMGLRNEFMYRSHPEGAKGLYEKGLHGWGSSIKDKCCMLHVVNKHLLSVFSKVVTDKPLLLARHGINEIIFDRNKYDKKNNDGMVIGTSGRSSNNKGFALVKRSCEKLGLSFVTAEFGRRQKTLGQMPLFYTGIDVYVCMSKTEGLNNGTMEAGAMGVPVISSRCGAASEMIKDGESGFLIDRTEMALKDALKKIQDSDLRNRMGNNFHSEIMSNWTWAARIKDFSDMFSLYFRKNNNCD